MQLLTTLEDFKTHCECRRLSPKTVSNYYKQIVYLIRFVEEEHGVKTVKAVQTKHIREFLVLKQNQGCKPAYVNDLLKAFKVFFRFALEEDYITVNPTEKVKNVKQPKVIIRTFDKREIKRMLDYYNGYDFLSIRNKTILVMLFDTGIRLSELTRVFDSFH